MSTKIKKIKSIDKKALTLLRAWCRYGKHSVFYKFYKKKFLEGSAQKIAIIFYTNFKFARDIQFFSHGNNEIMDFCVNKFHYKCSRTAMLQDSYLNFKIFTEASNRHNKNKIRTSPLRMEKGKFSKFLYAQPNTWLESYEYLINGKLLFLTSREDDIINIYNIAAIKIYFGDTKQQKRKGKFIYIGKQRIYAKTLNLNICGYFDFKKNDFGYDLKLKFSTKNTKYVTPYFLGSIKNQKSSIEENKIDEYRTFSYDFTDLTINELLSILKEVGFNNNDVFSRKS